jgi:hypothetical protein
MPQASHGGCIGRSCPTNTSFRSREREDYDQPVEREIVKHLEYWKKLRDKRRPGS